MNPRIAKLILPTTLVVTTFISANACERRIEYCEDIENMSKCAQEEGCAWSEAENSCQNACHEIDDEDACKAIDRCEWSEDGGDGTTGGGTSCHEPFT